MQWFALSCVYEKIPIPVKGDKHCSEFDKRTLLLPLNFAGNPQGDIYSFFTQNENKYRSR